MTQIPLDIERVVREVLAELKRAPAEASSSSSETSTTVTSSEPIAKNPSSIPSGNGELVISTRLVTMAEIDGRLAGVRHVAVNPQAVVTPAVRDALRQHNITLSRALPATSTAATTLRLLVVAARTKLDPKLLANTLQNEGINVNCQLTDCILDATDRLAGELAKNDALGLLLTPHTAAAMCLANRLSGVRAILGSEGNDVEADARAVGANLLIIDPRSVSLFKLSRMAGDFFRGGLRTCPEIFRKRLM